MGLRLILSLLLASAFAAMGQVIIQSPVKIERLLNIPPRFMWGWGPGLSGYCGSCSIQTAGIFHGNWISQDHVRHAVGGHEIIVGKNAEDAADRLHLEINSYEAGHKSTYKDYVKWIMGELDQNRPVVGTVYMKEPNGDDEFDHIVPIVGYSSFSHAGDGDLDSIDNVVLHFHDLYLQQTLSKRVGDWVATRAQCWQKDYPTQPYTYCLPKGVDNYGFSVLGVKDPLQETFPVQVSGIPWDEPDYSEEDNKHESPKKMTAMLTVRQLTPGKSYSIVRFDGREEVPENQFLDGAYVLRHDFKATATWHTWTDREAGFMSNQSVFYRCVALDEGQVIESQKGQQLGEISVPEY